MKEIAQPERIKKALKKFALFFVLALISVLIPVAHFVLVPVFLLLSVVMAWLEYRKRYHLVDEAVDCIHCNKSFAVDVACSDSSVRVYCTHCSSQNSISLSV